MKQIYIGATVQDSGKTCVSLGIMQALMEQGHNVGYSKPVGQHYVLYDNSQIDEDAVLVHQVFNMSDKPSNMSPVAIEKGFTQRFIKNPDVGPLEDKILIATEELRKHHDPLIVEGTGHAGVGSCFQLSNARVAELLGAKVVIVTSGGIGKPIDEVALNLALFKNHDVEVIGVILNKVMPEKYEKVRNTVEEGLKHQGVKLIGAIPYDKTLTYFNMSQIVEHFGYQVNFGHEYLFNRIENIAVAAMGPKYAVKYMKENTLVIVPFDRTDSIVACAEALSKRFPKSGGMIITGNPEPDPQVVEVLERSNFPVLASASDTYTVSAGMSGLEFKIRTFDTDKINNLKDLVGKHVDIDYILKSIEI